MKINKKIPIVCDMKKTQIWKSHHIFWSDSWRSPSLTWHGSVPGAATLHALSPSNASEHEYIHTTKGSLSYFFYYYFFSYYLKKNKIHDCSVNSLRPWCHPADPWNLLHSAVFNGSARKLIANLELRVFSGFFYMTTQQRRPSLLTSMTTFILTPKNVGETTPELTCMALRQLLLLYCDFSTPQSVFTGRDINVLHQASSLY